MSRGKLSLGLITDNREKVREDEISVPAVVPFAWPPGGFISEIPFAPSRQAIKEDHFAGRVWGGPASSGFGDA
ncbi:hypothetical protein CEXT_102311 [Caerostris extrusa]|uniref:Uncharacterized protein n=1 Tax=Caerostris extrusa TaxID=172846 RepID=A0AAV4N343_CAEEX|nr:hypothetical protein CEXT_102311 [Caerostris extrusa]